jgi:hypothetical protein
VAKRSKIHLDADKGTYRVTRFTGKGCVEVGDAKGTKYSYNMNNVELYAKKEDVDEAALQDMLREEEAPRTVLEDQNI